MKKNNKPAFQDIFLAYLVDYAIGVVFLLMAVPFLSIGMNGNTIKVIIGAGILSVLSYLLYYSVLEHRMGASLGKKLFYIRVITKKSNKIRPSFGRLIASYFIDMIFAGIVSQFFQRFVMVVLNNFDVSKRFVFLCGIVVGILMWVFYFAFREYKYGCTLGKKLMGLQVVQAVPQEQEKGENK